MVSAQTLSNQTLNGKYFFRHVSLGMDVAGSLTDPRSLIGTMTFDGKGNYSYAGQQVTGNNAAVSVNGAGKYAVDPAGFVALDSPLRAGATVNARFSPEALLGSGTESSDNTFDLLVAVPAPVTGAGATLAGPYWTVSLEFPSASLANARNAIFSLGSAAPGQLANFTVDGRAANLGGSATSQQVTGATYTMGTDGAGSASFGPASNAALLSGGKTLYVSASGNVILGGSTAAGAHDIVIGVKAVSGASTATWNGNYWGAGLRVDPSRAVGYAGSAAARGLGSLTWTQRQKALGFSPYDVTTAVPYTLNPDGSGTSSLMTVGLGKGAVGFVGANLNPTDPGAYEIYFGAQMASLSGSGVFLNPQGIVNGSSFAPTGNPISPGDFVLLFGAGLATSTKVATPPYPLALNGVTVLINGRQAALIAVSAGQVNALVPYATEGPTATIVVQNGSVNSNSVTVPVAATAPAIASLDGSGTGPGAVLHGGRADVVSTTSPAAPGEFVSIFLTGMGSVNPPVDDGKTGPSVTTLPASSDCSAGTLCVLVAGQPGRVIYSGLSVYPGLYQINLQIPPVLPGANLPLAIATPNAFHDQVTIAVQ